MPVIVRDLDDDAATIIMVDSNLQRENILPSERAFAYKMKLEAIKHQGARRDLTSRQVGEKLPTSIQTVAEQAGESQRQVQRFIRLTELIPPLLDMVDEPPWTVSSPSKARGAGKEDSAVSKGKTIGALMEEMRLKAGAQNYQGHDYMDLARFDENTRHMIIFDVLTHDSPVGFKGDRMRLFLSDQGYQKALENQKRGNIKILNHAKVVHGDLFYDHKDRVR